MIKAILVILAAIGGLVLGAFLNMQGAQMIVIPASVILLGWAALK